MEFNEYQKQAASTAVYNENVWLHYTAPDKGIVGMSFMYPLLALGEEVGEAQGKVAKFIRKSQETVDVEQLRDMVQLELGDVLWQLSECARQFGFTLEDIAAKNLEKLQGRKERGTIVGEGDNR